MSESKRARVDCTSFVRARGGAQSRENRESSTRRGRVGESGEEEMRKRETEGRGGKKRNRQPVTPRSTRPGLDNRDVSRAKNRPGTPGPVRLQSSSAFALESRGHARVGERASERANEQTSERQRRRQGTRKWMATVRASDFSAQKTFGVGVSLDTSFEAHAPRRVGARHGHSAARDRPSRVYLVEHEAREWNTPDYLLLFVSFKSPSI